MFQNSIQRRNTKLKLVREIQKTRANIRKAFAALRKEHLICKMNFSCCMGCACAELSPIVDEKKLKGAVYFHRQDNAAFNESGRLTIRYFTRTNSQDCKKLGELIVMYLTENGVATKWDGDPTRTIEAGVFKDE